MSTKLLIRGPEDLLAETITLERLPRSTKLEEESPTAFEDSLFESARRRRGRRWDSASYRGTKPEPVMSRWEHDRPDPYSPRPSCEHVRRRMTKLKVRSVREKSCEVFDFSRKVCIGIFKAAFHCALTTNTTILSHTYGTPWQMITMAY